MSQAKVDRYKEEKKNRKKIQKKKKFKKKSMKNRLVHNAARPSFLKEAVILAAVVVGVNANE